MRSEALAKVGCRRALCLSLGKRVGYRPALRWQYVRSEAAPRGPQLREVAAYLQICAVDSDV